MRSVYKYPLVLDAVVQTIEMPANAVILSAGLDPKNELCIWAMVDTDEEMIDRQVFIFGTGWDVTDFIDVMESIEFIDSIKTGPYMWHIFIDDPDVNEEIVDINIETVNATEEMEALDTIVEVMGEEITS